jgi:hypothetical protein
MGNNGKATTAWIIAVLFLSLFVGTTIYFNNQTAKLISQISSLKDQIANLTTANLVTALGETEVLGNSTHNIVVQPFNHLYISGQVNNTGKGTAYNAGLHVVAYDTQGSLKINITVPLGFGVFGTNNTTEAEALRVGGNSSLQLGLVYSRQSVGADLAIYHEGFVINWTLTPVWTNAP